MSVDIDTLRDELPQADVIFAAKHSRAAERAAERYDIARRLINLEDETTIERARVALAQLRTLFPDQLTPRERYERAAR